MIGIFVPRSGPVSDYFLGLIRGGNEFVRVVEPGAADIILILELSDLDTVWNETQLFHVVIPSGEQLPENPPPNVRFTSTMKFIGQGQAMLREQYTMYRPVPAPVPNQP